MIRAAILILLATPVTAQEIVFDPALVTQCYTNGEGTEPDCIGAASGLCQKRTEGGYSTLGMADCTNRETEEWDRLLNEEYGLLRDQLDEIDDGTGIDRSDALRDAQRAWIAYRDAECGLRYALWQGGTIRTTIGTACHLGFTAKRTLELRGMRLEGY
ncbi:lysozyme inhibitor LprI family protein [Jannaschia pohangensis]|uniref:Lysozyme inhibitor LprI-like N-terminal domain-containing protein n=1 Tax=Jannaschia pohangensis TaxID=390807 RepID=A0A1I3Q8J6_9RHOB|nr:lysozyme inhibitor LprI family protein [Jannaschia pohangensis]SFJ29436.1 Protein of unknown function [Jannaschia pohangensis]